MIRNKIKLLVTYKDYVEMGGIPERGMKFLKPYNKGEILINNISYEEVTFIELVNGSDIKVEEKEIYLGTITIFLYVEVTLFSNLKKAYEVGQKNEKSYIDWRKECIFSTIKID